MNMLALAYMGIGYDKTIANKHSNYAGKHAAWRKYKREYSKTKV